MTVVHLADSFVSFVQVLTTVYGVRLGTGAGLAQARIVWLVIQGVGHVRILPVVSVFGTTGWLMAPAPQLSVIAR